MVRATFTTLCVGELLSWCKKTPPSSGLGVGHLGNRSAFGKVHATAVRMARDTSMRIPSPAAVKSRARRAEPWFRV